MANRTDPLISSVSGSDPQNCMEYITRQRIYDCRYWKEECFGLNIEDVLEKTVHQIQCIGSLPYTKFLSLTLKLLQLNAEHDVIYSAFIDQDEFKYARALGSLYIRLTSRPVEIYESLEPLYSDHRKLRVYKDYDNDSNGNPFCIWRMDEFIDHLLTSVVVLGITLPRLPSRRSLQDAGYLPEGPRPTALLDVLQDYRDNKTSSYHEIGWDNSTEEQMDNSNDFYCSVLNYLRHKAFVEQSPAALTAWEKRRSRIDNIADHDHRSRFSVYTETRNSDGFDSDHKAVEIDAEDEPRNSDQDKNRNKKDRSRLRTRTKKKERNYDNLFKQKSSDERIPPSSALETKNYARPAAEEGSEEFWNEQRSKLGLKPLK